ncbi:MAG: hypothetical protein KAZ88_07020 [Acidimicrobiia bacterium]|nr:hypothetical protein [Acidimicrobiia bacterium]MBP8180726.1 hypothetical protein [Acidimicrobiia bacterium]
MIRCTRYRPTAVGADPLADDRRPRRFRRGGTRSAVALAMLLVMAGCSSDEDASTPTAVPADLTTTTLDLKVIKPISLDEADWLERVDKVCAGWQPLGTDITTLDGAISFITDDGKQMLANLDQLADSKPPELLSPESEAFLADVDTLQRSVRDASVAAEDEDREAFATVYDQLIAANLATDIDSIRLGLDACAPEEPSLSVDPELLRSDGWMWTYLDANFTDPSVDDKLVSCFHSQLARSRSFAELLDAVLRHATHASVVTLPAFVEEAQGTCLDAAEA